MKYDEIIWTNHAAQKLKERGVTQEQALSVFNNPDSSEKGKEDAIRFRKKINDTIITLVAKQNEKNKWIVLSVWRDPPLPGSVDSRKKKEYLQYQKASSFKKFLLIVTRQLGF